MDFGTFLSEKGIKNAEAAKVLGISRARVSQLCLKQHPPSLSLARRIHNWSGGLVTFTDWAWSVAAIMRGAGRGGRS